MDCGAGEGCSRLLKGRRGRTKLTSCKAFRCRVMAIADSVDDFRR